MAKKKDIEELEEELEEEDPDEEVDIVVSDNYSRLGGFAVGLVVGGILGASVALLMAPAKGEVLRRKLRYRVQDISDDAFDKVEQVKDDANRQIARTRRRVSRARRRGA